MARKWRGMEAGLSGGYADELHESLLSGRNAGDLSAAGGARGIRTSATQASLTGSLFHGGGLEGERLRPQHILDQALRWHVSSVNINSAPIPSEWKSQFESFRRSRVPFYLSAPLEYPKAVDAGVMGRASSDGAILPPCSGGTERESRQPCVYRDFSAGRARTTCDSPAHRSAQVPPRAVARGAVRRTAGTRDGSLQTRTGCRDSGEREGGGFCKSPGPNISHRHEVAL